MQGSQSTSKGEKYEGNDGDVLTFCLEAASKSMLSVGSGDGSQQLAIVKNGHTNIVTTFYDTKAQLLKKYPHAGPTLHYLQKNCPTPPIFGIDATKLSKYRSLGLFDLIFFTFPHTGVKNGDPANIASNQALLRGFLKSSQALLKPNGEIQITLKVNEHYEKWNLPSLLEETPGLTNRGSHTLQKTMFPGYVHRLTKGMSGKMKEVPDEKGACVHVFKPSESTTTNDGVNPFAGKMLTVVAGPDPSDVTMPDGLPLSDEQLEHKIEACLSREDSTAPILSVLEIRRQGFSEPLPDTRQLNRVLYQMKKTGKLQQHPHQGPNKKPQWSLTLN